MRSGLASEGTASSAQVWLVDTSWADEIGLGLSVGIGPGWLDTDGIVD